jgi:hypothetical protein
MLKPFNMLRTRVCCTQHAAALRAKLESTHTQNNHNAITDPNNCLKGKPAEQRQQLAELVCCVVFDQSVQCAVPQAAAMLQQRTSACHVPVLL